MNQDVALLVDTVVVGEMMVTEVDTEVDAMSTEVVEVCTPCIFVKARCISLGLFTDFDTIQVTVVAMTETEVRCYEGLPSCGTLTYS